MSHDVAGGLPRIWTGVRRWYLVLLVLIGLGEAASAGAGAHLLIRVLHGSTASHPGPVYAVIVGAALLVGVLRMAERIWTERLSQHYVHDVRLGLVRKILEVGRTNSFGVAMTRISNDLTSVKNWIAMGIAPLVVGIPIILGALTALALIDVAYALAFCAPLSLLALTLLVLRKPTYARTRLLRKRRGRLAQQVADTLLAARAIRVGGGARRELARVSAASGELVAAAISRAKIAGALRGAAAATTGLGTAAVIWAGLWAHRPVADTTAALSVVAFLVAPIHDLGRITEYRQTFLAARTMLAPAIAGPWANDSGATAEPGAVGGLCVGVLWTQACLALPAFSARPGDRVLVLADSATAASEAMSMLAGMDVPSGVVRLDGLDLAVATPSQLRRTVGYAAQGMSLVRGTIARNLRYRVPEADDETVANLIDAVGLTRPLAMLPDGIDTRLRHGGEPLAVGDRARVQLARGLLGTPSLLLLDRIDADLGPDSRDLLTRMLDEYPGIVVLTSDDPSLVAPTGTWDCRTSVPAGAESVL